MCDKGWINSGITRKSKVLVSSYFSISQFHHVTISKCVLPKREIK